MVRMRMEIRGVVQGVGFRPFVNTVAHRLSLTGFVGNDERGVFVEVDGVVMTGPTARLTRTPAVVRHAGRPLAEDDDAIAWLPR